MAAAAHLVVHGIFPSKSGKKASESSDFRTFSHESLCFPDDCRQFSSNSTSDGPGAVPAASTSISDLGPRTLTSTSDVSLLASTSNSTSDVPGAVPSTSTSISDLGPLT